LTHSLDVAEALYMNCADGWTVSDRIVEHDFRGIPYKSYEHSYFSHANEIESRFRNLHVDPGTVGLDIGASCGTWTLPMSFLCEKVYAFEPFQLFQTELRRNLDLNEITNVEIVPAMVGEWSASVSRLQCHAGRSSSGYIQYEGKFPCISIDDFTSGAAKVGFIKIDVEGGEMSVLRGGMATIKRDLPNVLVEIHPVYGVLIHQVTDFFAWASPHYSCTLMPQGDPSKVGSPCTIVGQHPLYHYHGFFHVVEPETGEFRSEFGGPWDVPSGSR